jgi:hypothetical protein
LADYAKLRARYSWLCISSSREAVRWNARTPSALVRLADQRGGGAYARSDVVRQQRAGAAVGGNVEASGTQGGVLEVERRRGRSAVELQQPSAAGVAVDRRAAEEEILQVDRVDSAEVL